MTQKLYELNDVEKRYGNHLALSVDYLELLSDRLYALTGPNGSGKSTLLQILAFLVPTSKGKLHFCGEEVSEDRRQLKRLRREVTLVHQDPYLFRRKVWQNLNFALKIRNISPLQRHERIEKALHDVGLEGFAQRQANELSGGEKQRVALARALVLQPRVLLLDEPTASINPDDLPRIEEIIHRLPDSGTTVIIATHDPHQPKRLGAIIIPFEPGRILRPNASPQTTDGKYASL